MIIGIKDLWSGSVQILFPAFKHVPNRLYDLHRNHMPLKMAEKNRKRKNDRYDEKMSG